MAAASEVLAAEDGPVNVPHEYQLPARQSFEPLSISATWDGSAAASAFLPCCSFYSQDGRLLARTFPAQVAVGDTAEVTYSPFVTAEAKAGLQFDVDPQEGNFLALDTAQYVTIATQLLRVGGALGSVLPNTIWLFGANDSAIEIDASTNRIDITTGSDRIHIGSGSGQIDLNCSDPAGKIVFGAHSDKAGIGGHEFQHGLTIDTSFAGDLLNPAGASVRLGARVNVGGKVELLAIFPTGAALVLATEV